MDLGLLQREASKQIGVSTDTYRLWEGNATHPLPQQWPRLIQFLGGFPFPIGRDLSGRLWAARLSQGLTQRELAEVFGVDLSTLSRWEWGSLKPGKEKERRIREWTREVLHSVARETRSVRKTSREF